MCPGSSLLSTGTLSRPYLVIRVDAFIEHTIVVPFFMVEDIADVQHIIPLDPQPHLEIFTDHECRSFTIPSTVISKYS